MPTVVILAAPDEELEAFRGAHRLAPVEEGTPFPAYRFRTGGVVVADRILTGDQFVSDPDPAVRRRLRELDEVSAGLKASPDPSGRR